MRAVALSTALAVVLAAPLVRADEPAQATWQDPNDRRAKVVARLGAVASYRGLYDLSLYGGGLALAVGGELPHFAVLLNARFIDARSGGGLVSLEGNLAASLEARLDPGFRIGGGFGGTYLRVNRATDGGALESWGPMIFARVGYDFGDRPNVFVLLDLEGQVQATNATPWGPTLQVGLRF